MKWLCKADHIEIVQVEPTKRTIQLIYTNDLAQEQQEVQFIRLPFPYMIFARRSLFTPSEAPPPPPPPQPQQIQEQQIEINNGEIVINLNGYWNAPNPFNAPQNRGYAYEGTEQVGQALFVALSNKPLTSENDIVYPLPLPQVKEDAFVISGEQEIPHGNLRAMIGDFWATSFVHGPHVYRQQLEVDRDAPQFNIENWQQITDGELLTTEWSNVKIPLKDFAHNCGQYTLQL